MKGTCQGCGKVRKLKKVETMEGKRDLCRACRRRAQSKPQEQGRPDMNMGNKSDTAGPH